MDIVKFATKLIVELEEVMITPITKDDLRFNDGIRAAITTVENARAKLVENTDETV